MDSLIYSLNSTIPIFVVMIIGWIIRKLNIINDEFVRVVNKYVFLIALPALLFIDISNSEIREKFDIKFVLFCSVVTTICFTVIWIITEIFMKDEDSKGSFVQGSFRGSAAVLGMAFIKNMYSSTGMAPLMIVAAVPLYNIFSVIVLTFKAKKDSNNEEIDIKEKNKANIKKSIINILKNPIIIAIIVGTLFSVIGVKIPEILEKSITCLADTATPMALIAIGAGFQGKAAIKKIKPTVAGSFIKLILQVGIFLPIAIAMGFRNQELVAILIMLGSPSTVSCYIMAKNMNNDDVLSSSIIVLTTLLSSITLTFWIFLLRKYGVI